MGMKEKKQLFVAGQGTRLRLGGYGATVHVEVTSSGVRVRTTSPRRQETLGPDSPQTRSLAVEIAEGILAPSGDASRKPVDTPTPVDLLTPRMIWEDYLGGKLGRLPNGILEWGRNDLIRFYTSLTPRARRALPSFDYVFSVLTAARRLNEDKVLSFDANLDRIEPGVITEYLQASVVHGASAHTMDSYFRRFRTAVRAFKRKWPKRWGSRYDLTDGVERPSTRAIEPPEIGEEPTERLLQTLKIQGNWRVLAAVKIGRATGRRIGSIGARRKGTQLDDTPLSAVDFKASKNGELLVTWRANAAKGRGFNRGDEVQVCTRELRAVYRWLTRYHPNPLGAEYPLIWDESDPKHGAPYDALSRGFERAWEATFRKAKPRGLLWHSLCRTTITTIADQIGIDAAAQHTGRSEEVARRVYKRRRLHAQARTAAVLDKLRSQRRS